jgi:hypothetical protein
MKREKKRQIVKECLLLFIAAYIDWVIQGERRALLKNIVLEDVVDFIMTYFAAITLFYFFRFTCLYKKETLIKKGKVKILLRFTIAAFLVLLWETLIYLAYSTFYYQEPLSETSFFYNGVPMIILILGFLAIYFYTSYYRITDQRSITSPPSRTLKELIVSKGDNKIVISEQDFSYFFTKDKLVWLSTWQGSLYVVDYTLTQLEGLLDPSQFFRANRQLILCRRAIQGYSPSTNQKIQVDFIKNEKTAIEDVTISKYNAPKFKKWLSSAEKGVPSV